MSRQGGRNVTRKPRSYYSIQEAAELLGTNVVTIRLLLAALRPSDDVSKVNRLRTSDLERLYTMLHQHDDEAA
jgi:hypothetical protein